MTTGETIKKERERVGLSQKELAKHLGISQQMLSFVEADQRFLTTDTLFDCARELNVSASYLLTGNTDENRSCAADDLGLKDETITRIRELNEKQKTLLELLINDEGLILSEQDLKKNPDLEPECGFLDALSEYACDPMCNWVVNVKYDPHDLQAKPKVKKMPGNLEIQFSDGTRRKVTEWRPDGKIVVDRLKAIRRKYLNSLEPQKYIPAEEEEDDE